MEIRNIHDDDWINPFGATAEEQVASALDMNGLLKRDTLINGQNAHECFLSYNRKRKRYQHALHVGDWLVKQNVITKDQFRHSLALQSTTHKALEEILLEENFCAEDDIRNAVEKIRPTRRPLASM